MNSPVVILRRDDFKNNGSTAMSFNDLVFTLYPNFDGDIEETDEVEFHAIGIKIDGKEIPE